MWIVALIVSLACFASIVPLHRWEQRQRREKLRREQEPGEQFEEFLRRVREASRR